MPGYTLAVRISIFKKHGCYLLIVDVMPVEGMIVFFILAFSAPNSFHTYLKIVYLNLFLYTYFHIATQQHILCLIPVSLNALESLMLQLQFCLNLKCKS